MKTRLLIILSVLILSLMIQPVYSITLDTSDYSLKKQIQLGWGIEGFFCQDKQVLILKISNKSPACVEPETKEKLLERGWAILTPKDRMYDIEKILNDNDKNCLEFGRWLDEFVDGNFNENNLIIDLPVGDKLSQRIYDSIPYCVDNDSGGFFKLNTKHFIDFEKYSVLKIPQNVSVAGIHPDTPEIFSHGSTKYVNPKYESLKYYKTSIVIDDTYLGKNVQQWQDAWKWELESNYEIYKDEFYEELGRLLVKNEITKVMNQVGIINTHDDFKMYQGYSLQSIPPHVGFTTVINATDGNSYLFEASANSNRVSYYSITKLTFFDTTKELPLIDILSYPQTIHILPEDGRKSKADPSNLIIHVDDNTVNFVNHTPKTIRIQESGTGEILKENELSWIGPTIPPFGHDQVIFEKPGIYEWDARIAPTLENLLWWGSHAGGDIVVISDNLDDLPLIDRLDMGRTIIMNSEVPYGGMGIGNADHSLTISLRAGIYEMLPDAGQYYQDRVEQLIPFDIPIILENPYGEE